MNTQFLNAITDAIKEMDSEDLVAVNNQYCQDCNIESEIYENDDEFFNTYFEGDPCEALRAAHFGDYNYSHQYVQFDGYANLQSYSSIDAGDLCENVDTIAEHIAANFSDYEHLFDFTEDDFAG